MDFEFSEEQHMVIDGAKKFAEKDARCPSRLSTTKSRRSTSPPSSSSASWATWA